MSTISFHICLFVTFITDFNRDVDDNGNVNIGAMPPPLGQMGMSSGFFVPPAAIPHGPNDPTTPANNPAFGQQPVAPPTAQFAAPVQPSASAGGPPASNAPQPSTAQPSVAFPLPPPTDPRPAPAQPMDPTFGRNNPVNPAQPTSTSQPTAAGGANPSAGNQASSHAQAFLALPSRTTPGQFLSHSARYMITELF